MAHGTCDDGCGLQVNIAHPTCEADGCQKFASFWIPRPARAMRLALCEAHRLDQMVGKVASGQCTTLPCHPEAAQTTHHLVHTMMSFAVQ